MQTQATSEVKSAKKKKGQTPSADRKPRLLEELYIRPREYRGYQKTLGSEVGLRRGKKEQERGANIEGSGGSIEGTARSGKGKETGAGELAWSDYRKKHRKKNRFSSRETSLTSHEGGTEKTHDNPKIPPREGGRGNVEGKMHPIRSSENSPRDCI